MPGTVNVTPNAFGGTGSGGGGGIGFGDIALSPIHFTENLLKDVGNATIGFIPGMYHLVTDPGVAIPAIAKGIAHDWAPLIKGHPGEFAKNFYEHPLGPLLDVAALFTGGAAAAGRGARLLSTAEYGTRSAETITRAAKGTSEAARLNKVVRKNEPVTLDAVLDATEPLTATTSYTKNIVRAGSTRQGERVIVQGGKKPGQFAVEITEPSWADRLAAFDREGSRTLELYDTVGAKGRIRVGAEARLPIPYQTPRSVAGKARALQIDALRKNFMTRGGTLGAWEQWSYEMQHIGRLGGTIAALGFQMGEAERWLKNVYDSTNGQLRYHKMQEMAHDWWDRGVAHGVATGRIVEEGQKFNTRSYQTFATKNSITRKIKHYKADGFYEERVFGMGGPDVALKDLGQLGRRMANRQHKATFTGKELIEKWGADATKIDPAKRYHVLADKHTMTNMGIDAVNSANFLYKGFLRGTAIWKTVILGFSPRFFLNNAVGNGLMFAFNYAGSGALFGIREYIRQTKGRKAMLEADADLAKAVERMGRANWMQQHFSDQWGQALHEVTKSEAQARARRGTLLETPGYRPSGRLERAAAPMFRFAANFAERPYRMAAVAIEVRADARVAAAMKRLHKENPKLSRDELFDRAATEVLDKNPDLVRSVKKNVEDVMGNYVALTKPERALRTISPFYAWQRHIVRNSAHMALDKPIRTALAAKTGEEGSEWAIEQLGGVIPHFAQGIIPFGDSQIGEGGVPRQPAWSTNAMNPWGQIGELARSGQSTLGILSGGDAPRPGETTASLLNPFVVAGIEAFSGNNIFTGAPQEPRDALLGPLTDLPQFKIGKAVLDPQQYDQPTMFKKDPMTEFMNLLGLTRRDIYLARLRQIGLDEAKGD